MSLLSRPSDAELVRITLPFAVLCPDNARAGVIRGRILLTSRYRTAKTAAHLLATAQMRSGRQRSFPRECALSMTATIYAPDRRRRDIANHAKLISDALEGACFADDAQLDDVRYVRGPVDKLRPRVEIILQPISEVRRP